jgi:TonB family protein
MPIILTMLAADAPAVAAAGAPITDPLWEQPRVTAEDLQKAYPPAALAQGVSGAAALECTVSANGSLSPCKVLAETPAGQQFGEAAVKVAGNFRMKTTTRSGASAVGRTVRIPIEFNFSWSAQAVDPRPSFKIAVTPRWIRKLDDGALAREYPDTAKKNFIQGEVVLRCQVQADGHLADCAVTSETPARQDFGLAATHLVSRLQMDTHDGVGAAAVGKAIDLPIHFRLPGTY